MNHWATKYNGKKNKTLFSLNNCKVKKDNITVCGRNICNSVSNHEAYGDCPEPRDGSIIADAT